MEAIRLLAQLQKIIQPIKMKCLLVTAQSGMARKTTGAGILIDREIIGKGMILWATKRNESKSVSASCVDFRQRYQAARIDCKFEQQALVVYRIINIGKNIGSILTTRKRLLIMPIVAFLLRPQPYPSSLFQPACNW